MRRERTLKQDRIVFASGKKSVTLTVDEFKAAGLPYSHHHSEVEGSPLGEKMDMTPEVEAKIYALVGKKFGEMK